MGEIKKIGEKYYIEFYARGLKYQQLAGASRKDAEKLLADVEGKIAQGEMSLTVRDIDIVAFLHDFLECAEQEHTAKSLSRYKSTLEHFQAFLEKDFPQLEKLSEVTPRVIEQYKDSLIQSGISAKVTNLTLVLLRDVLEYARKLCYLNDNPTLHIKLLEMPNHKSPAVLSRDQFQTLLKASEKKIQLILNFLLYTGILIEELHELRWSDVDQLKERLSIRGGREIPMVRSVTEILEIQKEKSQAEFLFCDTNQQQLDVRSLKEELKKAVKAAALPQGVSFITVRHTFAKNFLSKNFLLVGLAKVLGLNDVAKVIRYIDFVKDQDEDIYTPSPFSV